MIHDFYTKSMRYIQRSLSGFSLVEMLVYMSVTVVIAGAVVTSFLTLYTTIARNQIQKELNEAAQTSLERIVREVRQSTAIQTGASTFGTSPGVLTLTNGATTTMFSVVNGRLTLTQNGTVLGPLTANGVTITELTFRRYTNSVADLVRVKLTVAVQGREASSTETFYTSSLLRKMYE